jgi:hypothetical protein
MENGDPLSELWPANIPEATVRAASGPRRLVTGRDRSLAHRIVTTSASFVVDEGRPGAHRP